MDLKLDLARLRQLSDDLKSIHAEFQNADDFSDTVATATGNNDLAGTVYNFAHSWNKKRPQMTEEVGTLQKKYEIVSDHFTKLDDDLANALEKARANEASHAGGKAN